MILGIVKVWEDRLVQDCSSLAVKDRADHISDWLYSLCSWHDGLPHTEQHGWFRGE
jgi:hypothetical protein